MIACDTGFFVAFLQGNAKALEVWSEALVTGEPIVLSFSLQLEEKVLFTTDND